MAYEDSIHYSQKTRVEMHATGKYGHLEVHADGLPAEDTFVLDMRREDRNVWLRLTWDEARFLIAFLQRVVAP